METSILTLSFQAGKEPIYLACNRTGYRLSNSVLKSYCCKVQNKLVNPINCPSPSHGITFLLSKEGACILITIKSMLFNFLSQRHDGRKWRSRINKRLS